MTPSWSQVPGHTWKVGSVDLGVMLASQPMVGLRHLETRGLCVYGCFCVQEDGDEEQGEGEERDLRGWVGEDEECHQKSLPEAKQESLASFRLRPLCFGEAMLAGVGIVGEQASTARK